MRLNRFSLRRDATVRPGNGQQPEQGLLLSENTSTDASDFSQAQRGNSEDIFCPRCNRVGKRQKRSPVCKDCYTALQDDVRTAQERDYLSRWLSSRVDATGFPFEESALVASPSDKRMTLRLVKSARGVGAEWTKSPRVVSDATRMRALLAPFGGEAA